MANDKISGGDVITATKLNNVITGDTEPTEAQEGDLWVDTGNGLLKQHDGSDWQAIAALSEPADDGDVLTADGSGGVAWEAIPTQTYWQPVQVVNLDSGSAVAAVSINLPTGTLAVRARGHVIGSDASRDLWLRVNGISTGVYSQEGMLASSTSPSSANLSSQTQWALVGGSSWQTGVDEALSFEISVTKPAATYHAKYEGKIGIRQGSSIITRVASGQMVETSSLMTSISFTYSSTGTFYGLIIVEAYVP